MSSPTQPITGPSDPADAVARSGAVATLDPQLAVAEGARFIRAGRGGPPADLLEEMARAGETFTRLAADGLTVVFAEGRVGGRPHIELQSTAGAHVRTLTAAEAIALACGEPGPEPR